MSKLTFEDIFDLVNKANNIIKKPNISPIYRNLRSQRRHLNRAQGFLYDIHNSELIEKTGWFSSRKLEDNPDIKSIKETSGKIAANLGKVIQFYTTVIESSSYSTREQRETEKTIVGIKQELSRFLEYVRRLAFH